MKKYKSDKAKLSESESMKMLATLDNWQIVNGKIHKEFKFLDFEEAIEFVNEVASIAKSLDHHPEIFNIYNKVILELNTHDVDGLTKLDFLLAKQVDLLISKHGSRSRSGS